MPCARPRPSTAASCGGNLAFSEGSHVILVSVGVRHRPAFCERADVVLVGGSVGPGLAVCERANVILAGELVGHRLAFGEGAAMRLAVRVVLGCGHRFAPVAMV